ncbi:class I SAM-dependent methyltransferase [Nannocystaceae bacterium ST9]
MATSKKKSSKRKPSGPSQAQLADRHDLYEIAVQSPEADCELFEQIFRDLRRRKPQILREDFCGTAKLSRTWCQSNRKRRAIGIDFDGPTLVEARRRNVEPFAKQLGDRLQLVQADVLEVVPGRVDPADLIVALNFSFCVFKQREQLRRYLANAYGGLADDGVLMLEMFGGTKAIDLDEEYRELDDFTYHWEQESFNPLTNDIVCHIHFEFPDGSKLDKAFTYVWRLWTIPELRDLLHEVGFTEVKIYWETVEEESDEDDDDDDEDGDGMLRGTGEYEPLEVVEQQDSWLVYVVALK